MIARKGNLNTGSRRQPVRREAEPEHELSLQDLSQQLRQYARDNPELCAIVCFLCGFVIGWRSKPW